ncbi:MAG: hypothetical protein ACE5GO_06170, partial [Anaerolineales bacterium]
PFLAVALVWWAGGWLIATHAFRLEKRERPLVGFGVGMTGYLWFANVLGRWLPPSAAFVWAGLLVLAAGIGFAR